MSVYVISWVLRHSEEKLGSRLVLLVLADHANDDGTGAWPSVETIARHARLSRRQTQTCLRRLEAAGATRRAGTSPAGTAVWDVLMGGAETAPPGGEVRGEGGRSLRHEGGAETSPDPSLRTTRPKSTEPSRAPARVGRFPRPDKVDRRPVTDGEYEVACDVLAEFNRQAGSDFTSKDWVAKIVMRHRERPTLDAAGHARVIAAALADPWWKGPPSPSVVYGSGAQFERSIAAAVAAHAQAPGSRKLTPEEVAGYGSEWGPGTPHASLADARAAGRADLELDPGDVTEEDG